MLLSFTNLGTIELIIALPFIALFVWLIIAIIRYLNKH